LRLQGASGWRRKIRFGEWRSPKPALLLKGYFNKAGDEAGRTLAGSRQRTRAPGISAWFMPRN